MGTGPASPQALLSEGALVEGQHEAGLDPVGRSERICCSPRKFLSSEKTRSHEAELGVKVKMIRAALAQAGISLPLRRRCSVTYSRRFDRPKLHTCPNL